VNDAADSAETAAIQYVSAVNLFFILVMYLLSSFAEEKLPTSLKDDHLFLCLLIQEWYACFCHRYPKGNSGQEACYCFLCQVFLCKILHSTDVVKHANLYSSFHFRPVTDYNEVTLHFVQCVRMHIENTKSKVWPWSAVLMFHAYTPTIRFFCSLATMLGYDFGLIDCRLAVLHTPVLL
jgi:hypothetical protein